jgi:hypothetical protein
MILLNSCVTQKACDRKFPPQEYTTTQDYENFIRLINLKWTRLFVIFNPTHKVFAVETNITVIDEYYPHLVDAEELDLNTIYKKYI